jgi:hypothetical protein
MTEIDGQRGDSARRRAAAPVAEHGDLAKPYIVDVFRVTGGTTHDYTFHVSAGIKRQCNFPLVTNNNHRLEGSETWESRTLHYIWRNVSSNAAPGNFQITYATPAAPRDTVWMTVTNTHNVYLSTTPVPARILPCRLISSTTGLTRPSAIIRHRITSGVAGFVRGVIEPINAGISNIVPYAPAMGGTANNRSG